MPKSDLQKTGWFGFNPWFKKPPHLRFHRWVWVNTYRYIFSGMNIHKSQLFWGSPGVPGFWPIPRSQLGSTQEIVDDGVTLADPEIQRGSFFSLRHSMVEPDRKAFFRSPESFRSAVNVHLCVLFLCVCACAMHIYILYIYIPYIQYSDMHRTSNFDYVRVSYKSRGPLRQGLECFLGDVQWDSMSTGVAESSCQPFPFLRWYFCSCLAVK